MALLEIGVITRPQGLKGQFRVKFYSNFSTNFEVVVIDNKEYQVEGIVNRQTFYVLKLAELNTIEEVEGLRGKKIYAHIVEEQLAEDEYYVSHLIGAEVFADGESLGVVKDILQYGAADVFEVTNANSNQSFMFPFARGVLLSFDKENNVITLDGKILQEIIIHN